MGTFRTDKDQFILERCRGQQVLDIGCVNHTLEATLLPDWRHAQISKVATSVVGLDYEKDIVAHLNTKGWTIVAGDAQQFDLRPQYPEGFTRIVASELIEHLVDPGSFLRCARNQLAPGGELILSTPNAYGFAFFLETLIFGHEKINDDHTVTFSRKNMEWLLKKCGLRVKEFHWLIQDSSSMHMHTTWGSRLAAKIFFWLQCVAATFRSGFAKEMIVVAEKA